MLAAATASAHLVNYSILKIMNFFCPAMISKGPTILIPHWANGYGATMAVRSSSGNRVTLALIIVLDIVYSVDLHHRLVIASSQCFVHQFPCVGVIAANSFLNFYHNIFRSSLLKHTWKRKVVKKGFLYYIPSMRSYIEAFLCTCCNVTPLPTIPSARKGDNGSHPIVLVNGHHRFSLCWHWRDLHQFEHHSWSLFF